MKRQGKLGWNRVQCLNARRGRRLSGEKLGRRGACGERDATSLAECSGEWPQRTSAASFTIPH